MTATMINDNPLIHELGVIRNDIKLQMLVSFKTLSEAEIEDCISDASLKILTIIRDGKKINDIKAYFAQTARNFCISLYNKNKKRENNNNEIGNYSGYDDAGLKRVELISFVESISVLSEKDRKILVSIIDGNDDNGSIYVDTGIKVAQLSTRRSRIGKK